MQCWPSLASVTKVNGSVMPCRLTHLNPTRLLIRVLLRQSKHGYIGIRYCDVGSCKWVEYSPKKHVGTKSFNTQLSNTLLTMVVVVVIAFSAFILFVWLQEGHLAHKNFCLETSWDILMAINVSGQGTARCTLWVRRVSVCPMITLRIRMTEYWELRGQSAKPDLPGIGR